MDFGCEGKVEWEENLVFRSENVDYFQWNPWHINLITFNGCTRSASNQYTIFINYIHTHTPMSQRTYHKVYLSNESISLHIVNINIIIIISMITLRFSFKSFPIWFFFIFVVIHSMLRGKETIFRLFMDFLEEYIFISVMIYLINTITWLSHFLIAAHLCMYDT